MNRYPIFKLSPFISKLAAWFLLELILTFIGIDDMADYSEYLLQNRITRLNAQDVLIASFSR